MSTKSEISHAQNVANFEDLISRCVGFGLSYNPSLEAIKIASLNTLRTSAQNSIANHNTAKVAYTIAVDDKEIIFDPLKSLATRIMNALKASGANELVIKDLRSINYKIQGVRVKAIPVNENEIDAAKHISVSRQSVDSMTEHFSKLIDLLSSVPAYQPNENDLSVVGLNAKLGAMKTTNTAVINTTTNLMNAIIARNILLYERSAGLVFVANEVKFYVKSVFGARSPKYKEVCSIKFTMRKLN